MLSSCCFPDRFQVLAVSLISSLSFRDVESTGLLCSMIYPWRRFERCLGRAGLSPIYLLPVTRSEKCYLFSIALRWDEVLGAQFGPDVRSFHRNSYGGFLRGLNYCYRHDKWNSLSLRNLVRLADFPPSSIRFSLYTVTQ